MSTVNMLVLALAVLQAALPLRAVSRFVQVLYLRARRRRIRTPAALRLLTWSLRTTHRSGEVQLPRLRPRPLFMTLKLRLAVVVVGEAVLLVAAELLPAVLLAILAMMVTILLLASQAA